MTNKEVFLSLSDSDKRLNPFEKSAELVAKAVSLQPLLEKYAAKVDESRSLSPEVVEQIEAAGLLRLGVPKRYGGLEEPLQTHLRVSAALGKGCGSTAWVVQNLNSAAVVVGTFSKQAQDEVWGVNPAACIAGAQGYVPGVPVEGGWELSGRWAWLSGVEQADWAFLTFIKADGTPSPDLGVALVPISDGTVEDTWKVIGMRGTASNTLILDKVFVPEHRVISGGNLFGGKTETEFKEETLYRASTSVQLALILTGSIIGLAEAALDYVMKSSEKKGITYSTFNNQRESTGFQIQIAEADLMIKSARLHILRAAAEVDEAAKHNTLLEYLNRAHIRAEAAYAVKLLREAVQILVDNHGAATFAIGNPLQRIWRDLNTASRHGMLVSQLNYEIYGKALFEREDRVETFV